jgi:hypothetical protein
MAVSTQNWEIERAEFRRTTSRPLVKDREVLFNLYDPRIDCMDELRLTGMAQALEERRGQPDLHDLIFEDRLCSFLEREATAPPIAE